MSSGRWSRADKIGLIALFVAIVSCLAAIIVVPEVRHWFGLRASDSAQTDQNNLNQSGKKTENVNSSRREEKKKGNSNTSDPDKVAAIIANDKSNDEVLYSDLSFFDHGTRTTIFRIRLIDIAFYPDDRAYIKISACNIGREPHALDELYLWYTPVNGQDSVNWHLPKKVLPRSPYSIRDFEPLVILSPGECRVLGGWSDKLSESWHLTQPLGKLYIGESREYPQNTMDLGLAASRGLIQY